MERTRIVNWNVLIDLKLSHSCLMERVKGDRERVRQVRRISLNVRVITEE